MRNIFDGYSGGTDLVEDQLGESYRVVKEVQSNLASIETAAANVQAIIDATTAAGLAENYASALRNYTMGIDYPTPTDGVDPVTGVVDTRSFDVVAGGRVKNYLNDGGTAVFRYELATVAAFAADFASKTDLPANVADYGASPSATAAANVTAFQAALDTGRSVFIPGGTYNLNAKLTSTGKAVSIVTDGAVILKWQAGIGTNQGFDFTFSNLTTHTLSIGDIELVTECEGGGSAIKAVWPVGAGGFNRLWQLGKIRIRGADIIAQDGFWDYGLDTTNGWLGFCETLDFYGQASGVTPLSTAAWVARGTSTDSRVHIRARYAKAMLLIAGFSEGLDISGSFAVACDYAVDCTGTTGLNTPGFMWIGGHAACFKGGVRAINIHQGNVSDILVYKRNDSAQNFIAFDLDNGSFDWQISNCKVFSLGNPSGGTTIAVKDAGANNTVSNMRTDACDTDVSLVAGARGFSHTFGRADTNKGVITQGSVDGQVICLPGGSLGGTTGYFDILTANSATPSILGYRKWGSCGHILTASSVATTITDFTGGFPGDEFVLQANDANTTLQHSAGLQLNGAVNKVMASAETIRLRRVSSTAWKQI